MIELCQNIVVFGFLRHKSFESLLLLWKPHSWF